MRNSRTAAIFTIAGLLLASAALAEPPLQQTAYRLAILFQAENELAKQVQWGCPVSVDRLITQQAPPCALPLHISSDSFRRAPCDVANRCRSR